MARAGRLITLEGLDGSGKTTLAAGLLEAFPDLELLREPGGVPLAERIRELVTDPRTEVAPRAEALLYAAARAQLVTQKLRPLLADGHDVLLDRFLDSSLAYQGAGRELGVEAVREINRFGTDDLTPDLTLLLRIDPATGRARQGDRGAPDRLEREPEAFFAAVAGAYDILAAEEPERIVVVDAATLPSAVLEAAREAVARVLAA